MRKLLSSNDTSKENSTLSYRLIRSKRRSLSLSVDRDAVIVRAPERAPLSWIEAFVQEKQLWVKQQLELEKNRQSNRIRLIDGTLISVADREIRLRVVCNPKAVNARAVQTADALTITLPANSTARQQRLYDCFFRWITRQASRHMTERTLQLANAHSLQDRLTGVKFRRTKSKWGHCTSQGVIQYNPLIMLAPCSVIDYLIAHEVAHLRHPNHSARFWKLVERLHPDYVGAERWLNDEGYRLALEPE